jgi:hypothetical protein
MSDKVKSADIDIQDVLVSANPDFVCPITDYKDKMKQDERPGHQHTKRSRPKVGRLLLGRYTRKENTLVR